MRRYVLLRIVSILPTLIGVSIAVFLMVRLIPGTVVDQIIGTEGTYSEETVRTLGAMVVAMLVGVPLGILSARRENTALDHTVRIGSLFSLSIPVFWQATMLILAGSLWLNWAPPVDFVSPLTDPARNFAIIALPSLVLGTATAAVFMRMTRSSLLEVMGQDFVRTARAKGLPERSVVW